MKYLFVFILLSISSSFGDLDRIAKINSLKKEAKEAYTKGNFDSAIKKYNYLLDSMNVEDDYVQLNLANAYFHKKDTAQALNNYTSLTSSSFNEVRSVAQQQLGIMANRTKKYEEALHHFKEALKANPKNTDARYNYEMVKKALDRQKNNQDQDQNNQDQQDKDQQNKDDKKQDQQNKDQQNKDGKKDGDKDKKEEEQKGEQDKQNKDGEEGKQDPDKEQDKKSEDQQKKGEKGDEKKEEEQPKAGDKTDKNEKSEKNDAQQQNVSDKLEKMNISEEKAQMILEALKNKEIQYYQQNKHKATKQSSSSKPDW